MVAVDFLIVGQGIAGSFLAHQLIEKEKSVHIIDATSGHTSSRQATGLINPITGRRFVKSWMIDELMPFAETYYTNLQEQLSASFFKKTAQIKILQNIEQQNDLYTRRKDKHYAPFFRELSPIPPYIANPHGEIGVAPIFQIDVNTLQESFLQFFKAKNCIAPQQFNHDSLQIESHHFTYENIKAKHVLFAEGFLLKDNPFFKELPIRFSKGEALIIKSEELQLKEILNSFLIISPIGDDLYYAGTTYDWQDSEQKPTEGKRNYLIKRLKKSINVPYEIVDYKVGIRPTTKNRRPLLGEHPKHKNMFVFNGLGTKGLSLGPYFAHEMIMHILEQKPLHKEVNIKSYYEE